MARKNGNTKFIKRSRKTQQSKTVRASVQYAAAFMGAPVLNKKGA